MSPELDNQEQLLERLRELLKMKTRKKMKIWKIFKMKMLLLKMRTRMKKKKSSRKKLSLVREKLE